MSDSDFTEFKRQALARHLSQNVQGEVRFDSTTRRLYSTDASIYQIQPLGVVLPKTLADLHAAVQIATEMRVPITPRGGGTSLSGQSIGPGVVIDCSKYLNQILAVDPVGRIARVQPGVILDQLNRHLAPHGLQFGPDVATASRANLGGMIGNNSAGARSLVYGKTNDHVRSLSVLLADGSRAEFSPLSAREWERKASARTFEGSIYRAVPQAVLDSAAEIRRRFPRILRRVSGYNLDLILDQLRIAECGLRNDGASSANSQSAIRIPQSAGLVPLVVGSEGTLAVVAEAEVSLVPRPAVRGLLIPHFESLRAALDALAVCLEYGPSAVELLDQMLLDLARGNRSLRDTMAAVQGRPAALFMVEFSGEEPAEVADRVERLTHRLREVPGVTGLVPVLDPALRDPLWSLRSAAVPLLLGLPGDRKPVTFVEDTAVTPERLPEFATRFREVLARHGTDGAFYGHASVGCLHIRPVLNLKDPADVARMRAIMEDITDLVLSFGGALSGEHGDGLARSEWNRKMFGDAVYQAFRRVKHAFDPHGLLNPGKVVDAPPMTEQLRYGPGYSPEEPEVLFDYSAQEGFVRSVEMCNGSGVCRKLQGGTMCPSFRATRDEKDSTRGRANALRLALAGEGPVEGMRGSWVHEVLDLCLMCKACKSECPSNVDVAKLKAEFLNSYHQAHPRPLGHRLMARVHGLNRLGAPLAPLVNWLQGRRLVRWLLEKFAGIDRRRSLPPLYFNHFRRWLRRHKSAPGAGWRGRVILLDDCFTTFNEPEVGKSAVLVLEAAGYSVEPAGLTCCTRPMLSKGLLPQARHLIRTQAPALAARVADGTPILGLEPSCLLSLVDEWPELAPSPDTRRIAAVAELADGWLAGQVKAGLCELPLRERAERCLVHGHCHQKALVGLKGTVEALRLVPGLDVKALDTGCCGMAGSFGFEREHYDLSVAIARLDLLPALEADAQAGVIAPGTSCRHQIKDLAGRRALHPLEVLAGQLPVPE
ncbi:MAG: FAD-binding protein [Gemmataceae bacterium]|nr:FAD-binding protein [Gemmataceae bacterium]